MTSSLRFAGEIHPAVVLVISATAAAVVFWLYFRESHNVASPYRYLLPTLRAAAVAFAILILAGPVWHRRQVVGTLGRVIFAVDASESMSMTDTLEADASSSRLSRALRMLTGDDANPGWLESLQDTHEVDVIAFSSGDPSLVWSSSDDEPLPAGFEMEPDGPRTDLSTGMATTLATVASRASDEVERDPNASLSRAALVVLSDGRDNAGNAPLELAERLESTGVAVHGFGLGSEDEPSDLGIINVIRPENVASDGRLAGEIILRSLGNPTNQDLSERVLRIESNGKIIWQKTVTAADGPLQKIAFDLDVAEVLAEISGENPRGVQRNSVVMDLKAAIDPPEDDTNAKNNALPFRVAASTRDRRLLILDGSSRWETRYLRNLFERDPAWLVDTVLYGEGTDQPRVKRGEESGEFPNTREAMAKYDAIIM
ncbi:MAG: vWA domain-containing protein, partial [Rubripirellula sp.]